MRCEMLLAHVHSPARISIALPLSFCPHLLAFECGREEEEVRFHDNFDH
jgi:hypothetical protein